MPNTAEKKESLRRKQFIQTINKIQANRKETKSKLKQAIQFKKCETTKKLVLLH